MPANDVRILSQPEAFLDELVAMIGRAKTRIFLSSLYIGANEDRLINALKDALGAHPSLQVNLHLDYNRSTRPEPKSTARILVPLMQEYPGRVHIHLFRSPKLKGLMSKIVPRRFDEGWGTWHAKIYSVDDEVLISGANLNDSYFSNRQDRYLHFNSPRLAQYCANFLQTMGKFSFRLSPSSEQDLPKPEGSEPYTILWPHSNTRPEAIENLAGSALSYFQDEQLAETHRHLTESDAPDHNVLIFPIIQAGQFGIREEEHCVSLLFDSISQFAETQKTRPMLDLTSGYFNLYSPYQVLLRESHIDCRVLAASPLANGFYGSKGISNRIPEAYTHLETRFWNSILRSNRQWKADHGVQLNEWTRKGWTYHAKGIWLSPGASDASDDLAGLPVLSLFGSTNLNSRSANLDTELAFIMVVADGESGHDLRRRLAAEIANLRKYAEPWKGAERRVRLGTKFLVSFVGGML